MSNPEAYVIVLLELQSLQESSALLSTAFSEQNSEQNRFRDATVVWPVDLWQLKRLRIFLKTQFI